MLTGFLCSARLDMSGLAEAEAFKKNLWFYEFYGCDSKMAGAWLSPNGAAMMRVMAMGSTSIVASQRIQKPLNRFKDYSYFCI